MKVQNVNNFNGIVHYNQKASTPAFKGKGLDPDIIRGLDKGSKKWVRFLNYVGEHQGEALNIIVTAIGTAVVCPIFIAFNPFSKEDKNTKLYSAWRQPISAIIAVVAQLTITKWFNDWLSLKASTSTKDGKPALSDRADLRAKPHELYLKRIAKLQHPEYDSKQIDEEVKRMQINAEKSEVERYRKLMKNKPVELDDMLCQDYYEKAENMFYEEFKTKNKDEIEKKFGKNIDDIWSTKLKKHLDQMLDDKAKSVGKDKATLIKETAEVLVEKDVMSEAVAKSAIRHFKSKNVGINKAIESCTEEGVLKYIKDAGLENKFNQNLSAKDIAKDIVDKLNKMKEYESAHKLKDFTSVKNIGNTFEDILHNVKVKKMVRSKTSDAKRVFKTMNTQLGLVVTLATLPFTCGLLNWAYPRIMEKIMPEMSAQKKVSQEQKAKEGGNK